MSKVRTSHSIFRFREYKMPDGTVKEVFGDEAAPEGAEWFLADVIVEQTTIKTSNLDGPVRLEGAVPDSTPAPADAAADAGSPAPDPVGNESASSAPTP